MSEDGRDSETLSGSQAPTVSGSPPSASSSPPVTVFHPSLPLGEKFGSYKLLRPLGKGGMGEVYEAEHEETRRRVALKVLSHGPEDPTDRARFLREGRLAASISHPNSVYIYGTEEIKGTAVIAMELVPGGTLKDRVERSGPMPPREAVDAILQVVEGLEAAASKGVLHRDIKPSNCFVSDDGGVKVGDYGLSISTLSQPESHLTETGTFLGTPAFASPEQVRGDTVDMRSDIYSVGATLYYLVTGRAPFEGGGVGKLLSSVLERAPEPPHRLRPELPRGLGRVILRCLEKQPASRFTDYAALRVELRPFGSAAPTPATLGLRVVAGLIDNYLCALLAAAIGSGTLRNLGSPKPSRWFVFLSLALIFLYFGITEGLWGASLGKAILRLRVIGPDRSAPGLGRAFLRAGIWVLPGLPTLLFTRGPGAVQLTHSLLSTQIIPLVLLGLLYVTARRRNGFAGIHELASGTRVVERAALRGRPMAAIAREPVAWSGERTWLGPYGIASTLWAQGDERLLLGYDEALRRSVWIHLVPPGTAPVSSGRRDLARPARLRWLNGRRDKEECWDAYEAPEGEALLDTLEKCPPWSSIRLWLCDLAEELVAAPEDRTLPGVLAIDRVFLSNDGHAKLLDFRSPSRSLASAVEIFEPGREGIQAFLHRVGAVAVRGPVPLHARSSLAELAHQASEKLWVEKLRSDLVRPPAVSRQKRVYSELLSLILAVPIVYGAFLWLALRPRSHWGITVSLATLILAVQVTLAFRLRGGLVFRFFGIAVVTPEGIPASGLRSALRSLAAWLPGWLVVSSLLAVASSPDFKLAGLSLAALIVGAALILAGVICAAVAPERGLQERITKTFLVPI